MKKILPIALMCLTALLAACASADKTAVDNSNTSSQPAVTDQSTQAQSTQVTPPTTGETKAGEPAPAMKVAPTPLPPAVTPGAQPSTDESVSVNGPKLVVTKSTINFGKQPQDKKLIRAISIRNAGKADLHIESVVPS